jgi:hypothetical protein
MKDSKRWAAVVVYGIAMAWVEAAVVFYLRTLSNRIDPHQTDPLPPIAGLASTEMVREAATLVMLWAVGMLAGRTWRSRWGYAAIAFGVWDIFYYVFLRVITGWPQSLFDWDILFLLPLPWWGPVLSPVLIAGMMIVWGTLASQGEPFERPFRSEWRSWAVNFLGLALAMYVFMADTLRAARAGENAIREVLPTRFNWPLFIVALGLMAVPIVHTARQLRSRRRVPLEPLPLSPTLDAE